MKHYVEDEKWRPKGLETPARGEHPALWIHPKAANRRYSQGWRYVRHWFRRCYLVRPSRVEYVLMRRPR